MANESTRPLSTPPLSTPLPRLKSSDDVMSSITDVISAAKQGEEDDVAHTTAEVINLVQDTMRRFRGGRIRMSATDVQDTFRILRILLADRNLERDLASVLNRFKPGGGEGN